MQYVDSPAHHLTGVSGDLGEEDKRENRFSIEQGFRLLSVYHAQNGTKFDIIRPWVAL